MLGEHLYELLANNKRKFCVPNQSPKTETGFLCRFALFILVELRVLQHNLWVYIRITQLELCNASRVRSQRLTLDDEGKFK